MIPHLSNRVQPGGGSYNEYVAGDEYDLNQFIIDNTEIGEEYILDDICDEVLKANSEGDDNYKVYDSTQSDVLTAIKNLIADGFFEVTERDEYNGTVAVVVRVK